MFTTKMIKKNTIILVEKSIATFKKDHKNPDSKPAHDIAMRDIENKCKLQMDLKGIQALRLGYLNDGSPDAVLNISSLDIFVKN